MLGQYNVSYSTLFFQLTLLNIFLLCLFMPSKVYLISNVYQYLKELFFIFFLNFFKDKNISIRAVKFAVLYLNLFFFIL